MSRGIGQLQRDILAHLYDPIPARSGANDDGETTAYGRGFIPAANVYDLRHVCQTVQRVHKPTNKRAFQTAFSRAVRSLIHRGVLEPLRLVPIIAVCWTWRKDPRWQVEYLADGCYLMWRERQVRFVRMTSQSNDNRVESS